MKCVRSKGAVLAAAVAILLSAGWPGGAAQARDQIRIVGSSTVYPFAATVAERFGKTSPFKTPVIESTGSGGGMQPFCAGAGPDYPDIVNASRPITASERAACEKNKAGPLTEIKIGYDGIVLGNSKDGPRMEISRAQLFLALAKTVPVDGQAVANPYRKWNEIDPSLPDETIEVLGPPPTSGTRDKLAELVMVAGCEAIPEAAAVGLSGAACQAMREDGLYIEAGENDTLILRRLQNNPAAFGIFGFNVLDQNEDAVQGAMIEGVAPEFETISDGSYPVSRPLYIYVKNEHVGTMPGVREFLIEFTSDQAAGEYGYLADKGLVPLPEAEREKEAAVVKALNGG